MASLFDAETVNAAKYGEHACTAQEMAYRVAQRAAASGGKFLAALEADTSASGAQQVSSVAAPAVGTEPDTKEAAIAQAKADAALYLKMKGGK